MLVLLSNELESSDSCLYRATIIPITELATWRISDPSKPVNRTHTGQAPSLDANADNSVLKQGSLGPQLCKLPDTMAYLAAFLGCTANTEVGTQLRWRRAAFNYLRPS